MKFLTSPKYQKHENYKSKFNQAKNFYKDCLKTNAVRIHFIFIDFTALKMIDFP